MVHNRGRGSASSIASVESLVRNVHKGQKYGTHDFFDHHLVGVAELAREKARECNLDPRVAYDIGLMHDMLEDALLEFTGDLQKVYLFSILFPVENIAQEYLKILDELTHKKGTSYFHYIRGITSPYALLVKEADLEFHLLQDDAEKFFKYDLYCFALDFIRTKRILG
jgi:5'-deoxynucleotidase YfbR-like HD superfamily hydrolase